jgi:AraC family transcriptional regulator of adaptative response/methylated-DNA-[protein]-cysteine methyltransferase
MSLVIAKKAGNRVVPATERDARWAAVASRDRGFDGKFVYAVKTTGIYCRPSCPARLPKRTNVAFYFGCEDAEQAGFRACRRCKPKEASLAEQHTAVIAAACRQIEGAEQAPKLDALAAAAGMSPFYFHRLFKSVTGVTPKAYGAAHRAQRIRQELAGGKRSVTQAIYNAGFNSSSRFYATANDVLGMTPSAFRAGGADADIRFGIGECSLGPILVARSERGVCAIFLGDDPRELVRDLRNRFPKANLIGADAEFERLLAKVVGFVEAPRLGLDLPLDVRGTAFQQRVWQALRRIPAGATASYAEIARGIGAPSSVRAVAQACAANKIAVAIPCHRVVKSDGGLSGYRWGVERKRSLLAKEAQA